MAPIRLTLGSCLRCIGASAALSCILLLCGCDEDAHEPQVDKLRPFKPIEGPSKKGKPQPVNQDPTKFHEEMIARLKVEREKSMKAQETAIKKQEKEKKKKEEKQEKQEKDPDSERDVKVLGDKQNVIERDLKDGRQPEPRIVQGNTGHTTARIAEIKSPHATGSMTVATQDETGEKKYPIGTPPKPKSRGFFARLFKGDRDSDDGKSQGIINEAFKKPSGDLSNLPVGPREHKDTALSRVQAVMAQKRLVAAMPPESQPAPDARAEIVPLPPAEDETAKTAAGTAKAEPATEEGEEGTRPRSEAEIKAAAEEQYQAGLRSRDAVAREASIQLAAMERRADAIPFLIEEIKQNMFWAELAARCLGVIGKATPEVETALLEGLRQRDARLRLSSAESLGRLRCARAVSPLIESLKTEKNLQCRCVYAEALGLIGDRAALAPLKARLEDRTEVDPVKVQAALALARLGDPCGRAHLVHTLDSPLPAMQVLGLRGIVQVGDPDTVGYLNAALESRYDEVWTMAVMLFPRLGAGIALPVLRRRFEAPSEILRRRAALAMGFLGSDEGLPYIDKALREGSLQERAMACELIANLARDDRVPLLVERLQDPSPVVRRGAAVGLTRLNATDALPALMEAARGSRASEALPPALRGSGPDMYETLVILSCIRILRGEKEDLVVSTLPNAHDNSWPEVDRALYEQQFELLKQYKLVDVISADNRGVGAVIRLPNGKEVPFREGEPVAAGFRVRDIGAPQAGKDHETIPGYVTLIRGNERVTLITGKPPVVDKVGKKSETPER